MAVIKDQNALEILETILAIAGPNFTPPYDSEAQPYDGTQGNQDTLLQFNMPGGSSLSGYSEPSEASGIGSAINSLLAAFAPAFSAYAFLLPILGIIRGIIEVLCALMNPFAVTKAVIRLFKKWIPPFLSLFPPLAGVVLILSVIKAILAIVFYILTVVIPTLQLIVNNVKSLLDLDNTAGLTEEQKQVREDAINAKIQSVINILAQKAGILGVLQPILDLVFLILSLVSGFPCKGKAKGSDIGLDDNSQQTEGLDSSCCDDFCPDILSNRNSQPKGIGVLIPSSYGDCAPGFVFQIRTNNPKVQELEQFQESTESQLNCQLDEPIKFARPPGATQDGSLIKIRLTTRRGTARSIVLPVLDINGTVVKISSPLARLFTGAVNYVLEPDYDMMVRSGVMGVGCHPDVKAVKDDMEKTFTGLETPVTETHPEVVDLPSDVAQLNADIKDALDRLRNDPTQANDIQNELVNELNDFISKLTKNLNTIINRLPDSSTSEFELDKNVVFANAQDFGTITVTPRDITRSLLLKNLPAGVGLNVEIFTTFGTITNQQVHNSSGTVTAEIRSASAGNTNITVRINGQFIVDRDVNVLNTRIRTVRFTQEAVLPARRRRSKPTSGKAINTGVGSEREPGSK